MVSLGADDNHIWSAVQNAVRTGSQFVMLGEGNWNGTTKVCSFTTFGKGTKCSFINKL